MDLHLQPDAEAELLKPAISAARARLDAAIKGERRTSHLPPGCRDRDAAVEELRYAEWCAAELAI